MHRYNANMKASFDTEGGGGRGADTQKNYIRTEL